MKVKYVQQTAKYKIKIQNSTYDEKLKSQFLKRHQSQYKSTIPKCEMMLRQRLSVTHLAAKPILNWDETIYTFYVPDAMGDIMYGICTI